MKTIANSDKLAWVQSMMHVKKYSDGIEHELDSRSVLWMRRYGISISKGCGSAWMDLECAKAGLEFDYEFNSVKDYCDYIKNGRKWIKYAKEIGDSDKIDCDIGDEFKDIKCDYEKNKRRKVTSKWRGHLYACLKSRLNRKHPVKHVVEDEWQIKFEMACKAKELGLDIRSISDKGLVKWIKIEVSRFLKYELGSAKSLQMMKSGLPKWVAKSRVIRAKCINDIEAHKIKHGSYALSPSRSNSISFMKIYDWISSGNNRSLEFVLEGCLDMSEDNLNELKRTKDNAINVRNVVIDEDMIGYDFNSDLSIDVIFKNLSKVEKIRTLTKEEKLSKQWSAICMSVRDGGFKIDELESKAYDGACIEYVSGDLTDWQVKAFLSVTTAEEIYARLAKVRGWGIPVEVYMEMKKEGCRLEDVSTERSLRWRKKSVKNKSGMMMRIAFEEKISILIPGVTKESIDSFFAVVDK